MYYYGARYMDPGIGRFLTPDTAPLDQKNPQSLNRYSYGLNNPLKYIDPTGHSSIYNQATQPRPLPPDAYAPPVPSSPPAPVPAPTPAGDPTGPACYPGSDTDDAPVASAAPTPSPDYADDTDSGSGVDAIAAAGAVAQAVDFGSSALEPAASYSNAPGALSKLAGSAEPISKRMPYVAGVLEVASDVPSIRNGDMTPNQAVSRGIVVTEVGLAGTVVGGIAIAAAVGFGAPIIVPVAIGVGVAAGVWKGTEWIQENVFTAYPETFGRRE